jgi:GntR family transcriptional regulator
VLRGLARGYSLAAAQGGELRAHHVEPDVGPESLDDPRLAHLLNVPLGGKVMRRLRVTGSAGEAALQISTIWIRPWIVLPVAHMPQVAPDQVST